MSQSVSQTFGVEAGWPEEYGFAFQEKAIVKSFKKSHIQKILNLLTDADSITIAIKRRRRKNLMKISILFEGGEGGSVFVSFSFLTVQKIVKGYPKKNIFLGMSKKYLYNFFCGKKYKYLYFFRSNFF